MSLGNHNPFAEMDNTQLSIELVQLVKFSPLTDNAQKLLITIGQRLSNVMSEDTHRQPETFIRGLDFTTPEPGDADSTESKLINLLKDAVYGVKIHTTHEDRDTAVAAMYRGLTDRVSIERIANAQVYVQINQDLSHWRLLLDLKVEEGTHLIRHYLSDAGDYYAYHIEFVRSDAGKAEPYSTIPPAWNRGERWDSIRVDFDTQDVTHYFTTPSTGAATGAYVCDLKGNIKLRYDPQHL